MFRCQICFDELGTNGQIACTPCGHAFCSDCLVHALQLQAVCPSCRSPVESKQETLPAADAQRLITELCRKLPVRKAEIERLGPRPVRLYLDRDEPERPPEGEDDVVAWQQTRIAELSAKLGEAEKIMELAKVEKSEELALLQVQVKGLEKTTQRAVDRAWRKETELEENERHWTAFFEILAKERVVLENALYEKDKELKKAKVKEERYDRDVQELRDRMAAMEKRDKEHLERIGDAAHTMNRKQKKITRLTASYQLAKEREMALQAELDRLKASSSTSKSAGRKPLHPLSPNSQCSDSAVPAAQDAFILTEDNSLEVVSTVDDGDLDPSMDLTAGAPRQRTHPPPPREWLAPPTKRRKLEKKQPLNDDVRSFLDPRTGKMMKGVVTGARRRVRAQPY